ncbi:MAG: hypothetical protein HY062_12535 [Bacteroidetes bacterium]|nr:hypothetical protein [Bacteroidota bacterium]
MKNVYLYINGSGSPFWLDEKKNDFGTYYYSNLFWPENASIELKDSYNRIFTLYQTYQNPIDHAFPSLWTQEMCDLYNQLVADFFKLAQSELTEYTLLKRYSDITQDPRLLIYRQNILKSHSGQHQTMAGEKELEEFLKYKQEFNSALTTELPFEVITRIAQSEYDTLHKITLNFGIYHNFQISICPYSFKTYIADINIGGHFATYHVIRINRTDIFNAPEKLIQLAKTLNL